MNPSIHGYARQEAARLYLVQQARERQAQAHARATAAFVGLVLTVYALAAIGIARGVGLW